MTLKIGPVYKDGWHYSADFEGVEHGGLVVYAGMAGSPGKMWTLWLPSDGDGDETEGRDGIHEALEIMRGYGIDVSAIEAQLSEYDGIGLDTRKVRGHWLYGKATP